MKTEKIAFDVPEDLLASLKIGVKGLECEMREFLAIQYFKNKRLSLGKAAQLAGMSRLDFMDLLIREGVILFDYDETAIKEELKGIKKLEALSH